MVAINAHFDGKVIVPDEPIDLKPNQRLRIHVEPIEMPTREERMKVLEEMRGLALRFPENPNPKFEGKSDDELWGE
jgi:hypothetical protein